MTDAPSQLTDAVLRALGDELGSRGFQRIASGIYMLDVAPGCRGWIGVGLAAATRGGAVDADPMVGVRHDAVEALLDEDESSATVFRPLYELFSPTTYRTWTFELDRIAAQARALGEAVELSAVPFMESLASLEAVERALREWGFADVRRRRLPAVVLIQVGADAARAEAERELALLEDEDDEPQRSDYEAFIAELLDRAN
jgi:hypothetical protein